LATAIVIANKFGNNGSSCGNFLIEIELYSLG